MSTSITLHNIERIDVATFLACAEREEFTRIRFSDAHGNDVSVFPDDMAQFIADICAAAEAKRTVGAS